MLLLTSGLRISEGLSLKKEDIDFKKRSIFSKIYVGNTKRSWIIFYTREAAPIIERTIPFNLHKRTYQKILSASIMTGIKIIPNTLRSVFADRLSWLRSLNAISTLFAVV